MSTTSIPEQTMTVFLDALSECNMRVAGAYPGERPLRQPVHTVYGGAHLFKADVVQKLGAIALRNLREYAPDPAVLAEALNLDGKLAERIYPRILDKLQREPVEDFRIDFEDGFGHRSDEEEDQVAVAAAQEVAAAASADVLPSGIGIRIKSLGEDLKRRSLRTFDRFFSTLVEANGGAVPPNFVITLPKITASEQVAALASACDAFEYHRDLLRGTLKIELMVETTQAVVAADGSVALPRLVSAGRGRVVAAHFGPYDYTAACNVTAAHQGLDHPLCDFARHLMQAALAGTGVWLSDGPTNIMPIGPHRPTSNRGLTADEREENARIVHRAWRSHAASVRNALMAGIYQGWDLHPAQLPSRYATVFGFFLESLDSASERLRNFIQEAAQATRVGNVFDDAATGQGLLNYFLRALNCGAIDENEAVEKSDLTLEELRGRVFARILEGRRGSA
jgi:citrate lyase beta subunit